MGCLKNDLRYFKIVLKNTNLNLDGRIKLGIKI